jgi:hypothetical protein
MRKNTLHGEAFLNGWTQRIDPVTIARKTDRHSMVGMTCTAASFNVGLIAVESGMNFKKLSCPQKF